MRSIKIPLLLCRYIVQELLVCHSPDQIGFPHRMRLPTFPLNFSSFLSYISDVIHLDIKIIDVSGFLLEGVVSG